MIAPPATVESCAIAAYPLPGHETHRTMTPSRQAALFRLTSTSVRLIVSGLVGFVVGAICWRLRPSFEILVTYDAAVLTYVAMLAARMAFADADKTRELAEERETSNAFVLTLAALFSLFSLTGVALLLDRTREATELMRNIHLGLSLLAIALSWILLHLLFAVHYARLYYDEADGGPPVRFRKGLDFPDDILPDFLDFLYFSFTIAVCYQTSDVTIRSRPMRRVTLAHALLSFLNVTVILGLVIEIVSSLV